MICASILEWSQTWGQRTRCSSGQIADQRLESWVLSSLLKLTLQPRRGKCCFHFLVLKIGVIRPSWGWRICWIILGYRRYRTVGDWGHTSFIFRQYSIWNSACTVVLLAGWHWANYLTFLLLQPLFVRIIPVKETILGVDENVYKASSTILSTYTERHKDMVAAFL